MQHTVIAFIHDQPHALNRAISLFRRSAYRIDSLVVTKTAQLGLTRLTLVVQRDDVAQVVRELEALVDVVSARVEFTRGSRTATSSPGGSTPAQANALPASNSPYTWQADGAIDEEAA